MKMNTLGFDKPPAQTCVVVAMSGGVDSSVTAALLKSEGYDVIGVTLQLYNHGEAVPNARTCCAGEDIHDARKVAGALDIPHYVLDYESRFRADVMDGFADGYLRGETPIPCVACNQTVKFRDLLATAKDLGAHALATGHYVRRMEGANGAELHRGTDPTKDQSYFLFATTPDQLDVLRFPLGSMGKDETRALAQKFGLSVAEKPDSQDICFVPGGDYAAVVEKLRPGACDGGDIVHVDGRTLGRHHGIIHYTVGQRRGLNIGGDVGGGAPLYVVRLEPDAARVIVGPKEALLRDEFPLGRVNWLAQLAGGGGNGDGGPTGLAAQVKIRSTTAAVAATVHAMEGGRARVVLDEAQAGVAPGQACVFYDGDRVLGGGWIERG